MLNYANKLYNILFLLKIIIQLKGHVYEIEIMCFFLLSYFLINLSTILPCGKLDLQRDKAMVCLFNSTPVLNKSRLKGILINIYFPTKTYVVGTH